MKTIGSQRRETLEESGMQLIKLKGDTAYLKHCGHTEVYVLNDYYAGYVVEINGFGYEFVESYYD